MSFLAGWEATGGLKSRWKEWLKAGQPREENKIRNYKTWAGINTHGKHQLERYVLFQTFLDESKQDTFSPAVLLFSSETSLSARIWKGWNLGRADKHFGFQCLRAPGISGATRHQLPSASVKHFHLPGSECLQGKMLGAAVGCFLISD